jgi:Cu/Ag efflux pump CusA
LRWIFRGWSANKAVGCTAWKRLTRLISRVVVAVRQSNVETSGRLLEFGGSEYMIRGRGYLNNPRELEEVVVAGGEDTNAVRLKDVSALIPILTIPITVLVVIVPLHLMGLSFNVMSLGGIALAAGALVDAAIVVVEQTHKKLEEWRPPGVRATRTPSS